MNDLIQEFAEQAGLNAALLFNKEKLEKFTELIVKESANWINENVGMIDEEARKDLLKHFGIV